MGKEYDLSQFLVNPGNFAFDSAGSQVANEYMTEMLVVDLPRDFDAARACEAYDEIMDDVDPDYPPHLFMVIGNNGYSNLLITFRAAVEIATVKDSLDGVLRQEISDCGEDGERWALKTCPLTEGVFDIVYHYYVHGFDGPQ